MRQSEASKGNSSRDGDQLVFSNNYKAMEKAMLTFLKTHVPWTSEVSDYNHSSMVYCDGSGQIQLWSF